MRLLRIVPDNTKFDFMRFRRISFPISALMSILAISLYFFHGLNFGIDFKEYEQLAMDLMVKIIERYLAQYRTILRDHPECSRTLMDILDVFVRVGWPSAHRLAYRLNEIYQ